ncbi:MAG: hypothetical protein P8L49_02805, partial [Opitutaceae bacterium]|nr:hypothetical protein [Opitutaceae bacterium]
TIFPFLINPPRIILLDSEGIIVNVLLDSVLVENITYEYQTTGDILMSDGAGWRLELTHL